MTSSRAAGEGFSRGDRLRKRREFEECYSSGVRASGRHLQVFLRLGRPGEGARLGISIPRRSGNAVRRNRLRRRLREIFRRGRSSMPGSAITLVVNARPGASAASYEDLSRDFHETLARALARLEKRG